MDDKKDLQEFDLDDILNEFQDQTEDSSDLGELSEDLAQLVGDWDSGDAPHLPTVEVPSPVSMDTGRMNDLIAEIAAANDASDAPEAGTSDAAPEASSAPMDTIRMNELIAEIMEQSTEAPAVSAEDTIRVDAAAVSEAPTIRMEPISPDAVKADGVSEDATIRMDAVSDSISHCSLDALPVIPGEETFNTVLNLSVIVTTYSALHNPAVSSAISETSFSGNAIPASSRIFSSLSLFLETESVIKLMIFSRKSAQTLSNPFV